MYICIHIIRRTYYIQYRNPLLICELNVICDTVSHNPTMSTDKLQILIIMKCREKISLATADVIKNI